MWGSGEAPSIWRRDQISLHSPKPAPVLHVSGGNFFGFPVAGRDTRFLFREWGRCGRRLDRAAGQHCVFEFVFWLMPLASTSFRRQARLLLMCELLSATAQNLERIERTQRTPHAVRVDESFRGSLRSFVCAIGIFRRNTGPEAVVNDKYEVHQHDVLIIGAGGAGLRAAIEALAQGASVGVVCKSLLGKAHTVMAEGGIAAAMANVDQADDWRVHFGDTIRGGKFLNNWRMAKIHAQESSERVRELERWGALFDRTDDGRILQRAFGGHTFKRLCHVGDRTGLEMIRTLQDRGVQMGFDVYMECTVTRLLKDGDRVAGAFAYWRENGRFVVLKAKAIVLATGGIGKAYPITSNSWEYTGDGMALAYEAGAELMDMEFVQFHPTGMVWPPGVQGLLVTEAVRGEGGILRNKNGERFMEKYDPQRMELSTRDVVARSIYTEVKEGRGTEHGGAYLDISQKPAEYVK